jgi:rare lipoprotein A
MKSLTNPLSKLVLLGAVVIGAAGCQSHSPAQMVCSVPQGETEVAPGNVTPGKADLTGSTRLGKASFYAQSFAHRLMANGHRMDPQGANAASRTLPLGTIAKVINVQTGKSAIVSIEDRGPYVKGRILDLSPATAQQIGITSRVGVAEVKIAPIAVRLPDGTMKPGSGAPKKPLCKAVSS